MRDERGQVRWRPLLAVLTLVVWATFAFADTYEQTGILNLMRSQTNGGVVSPLWNGIPQSADYGNLQDGDFFMSSEKFDMRQRHKGATYGLTKVATTNVTLSDQLANPTTNTSFSLVHLLTANTLVAGKRLRVSASGKYTSGLAGNANLVFTLECGPSGQAFATTSNVSTTTGADKAWTVSSDVQVYTAGASGTLYNVITGSCQNAGTTDSLKVGRATGAIDTTAANRIALEVKFSASDATNVIKMEDFAVEVLN